MKKIINPWEGLDGYMCFGCAPSNPMGLHMEFYEDGDDIVAYWEPEAHYQGWLNTLHGGILTTLMDELACEPRLTIRGRIKDRKRNAIFIETEIYNSQDELCTRADLVYFIVTQEQATEKFHFAGCKAEGE